MYICDKLHAMKKVKNYDAQDVTIENNIVSESAIAYETTPNAVYSYMVTEMSYNNFKTILDLNVFTIAEWANLLQISERTMHRFAKENLSFNGILTERINLLHQLIKEGISLFGPQFKAWLNSTPFNLFGQKPIFLLHTHLGILEVYKIIKRMQHGIVA
jgi:uncharacterized protein (DUF2384 family)